MAKLKQLESFFSAVLLVRNALATVHRG